MREPIPAIRYCIAVLALLLLSMLPAGASELERLMPRIDPTELAPDATGIGPVSKDAPVAPLLKGSDTIGWVFVTSDFVGTTGYSGRPIHVAAAVSPDAVITGAQLVEHGEPIVLIGIPESKVVTMIRGYTGTDLKAQAAGEVAHDLDIISGATVTVRVIDDSLLRAGVRVARTLGLGGLSTSGTAAGPEREIDLSAEAPDSWEELLGDGTVRRLTLDVGQINEAFEETGDERAAARPERGEPDDSFVDMNVALVSVPAIGKALLSENDYRNLANWLEEGEQAILVTGSGRYSFKGSGYVRGGIFDRISLHQGDQTIRFHDRQHRRVSRLAPADAPRFREMDLFKIRADEGFDPTEPFEIELLVSREVGPVDKSFLTFNLGYGLPEDYLTPVTVETPATALEVSEEEAAAKRALWQRIWKDRAVEIGVLVAMLLALTGGFFFQFQITRHERLFYWLRMSFLTMTLFFIGWYATAQLSVVNLIALGASLRSGFTWDAFLLDPLVFIQWFAVAASLIFWGRGAYCGWLCPFGALQELSNQIARALKVPQWTLPWSLHERLWPVKYILFLGLFGASLYSVTLSERLAEVEPFKTAIILKFLRDWPFVVYALVLLVIGLFIERFYCRYLCPLGAALAIPARIRMFDWLRRYKECGNPCQTCANECPVQAIHPTGEINPNECIHCLHCQVLYQSPVKCPVVIRRLRRRASVGKVSDDLLQKGAAG
ncbi:NosR/NirI family transcriptional regulator, nitrous oxide reductase regulator [Pontibaca methylaminivorans]|uniref:NosR/NirI family transcriptional regulator, nitrous oxide reductase regulator n=2 Tax=Pontibaca methylaminivorans TaxID=515897 RepID=A0A1R3WLS5_9RHOB|nr:NosR/NirI family transcriptional regulator, nitrous oxide reductase regulator [Pontibaca methylaminivorans]